MEALISVVLFNPSKNKIWLAATPKTAHKNKLKLLKKAGPYLTEQAPVRLQKMNKAKWSRPVFSILSFHFSRTLLRKGLNKRRKNKIPSERECFGIMKNILTVTTLAVY